MKNQELPMMVIQAMFNEVVCSLKRGHAKDVGGLAKYALRQYYCSSDTINRHFDLLQENFMEEYINNESLVEGITDEKSIERTGLQKVYNYIFSSPMDENFDIYLLCHLHKLLFSDAPFPEASGKFRNAPARIEGAGVDLCLWENISESINDINKYVLELIKKGIQVFEDRNTEEIFEYIEECVKLNCHLIQIHPFFDGNGRTVRAFTNKMFVLAGIPPVYIHSVEVEQYHKAMENAIARQNYDDIIQFYYIKICQSIYELALNPNRNIKKRNTKRIVKRTVENYQENSPCKNCNANDLSTYFADNISRDLNELGVDSTKHLVNNLIYMAQEYEYLMVYVKKEIGQQSILIDPALKFFVKENQIMFPTDLPKEDKLFLIEIYQYGCAEVTPHQLEIYLEIFSRVNVCQQKHNKHVKCKKKYNSKGKIKC